MISSEFRWLRMGAFFVLIMAAGFSAAAQEAPRLRFLAATAQTHDTFATGAVGPDHVVSIWQPDDMAGPALDIFTRSGVLLQRVQLQSLWEDTSAFAPSIFYDPHQKRFVLAAYGYRHSTPGVSTVPVAVSRTANPLDGWHPIVLNHGGRITGVKLGFNRHWYAITVYDAYSPLEPGRTHLYVLESLPAASGAVQATAFDLKSQLALLEYFDPFAAPCATYDGSDRLYIVGTHTNDSGAANNGSLRLAYIDGPANDPVFSTSPLFPQAPSWSRAPSEFPNTIPAAVQPSVPAVAPEVSGTAGSWNDSISSAVFRNGYIWCAHTIGVANGSTVRATVQWWQISPETGATIRSGRLHDALAPEASWYAPAMAVNTANEMLIGANRSSQTESISSYYIFIDQDETVVRRLNAGSGSLIGPLRGAWAPSSGVAVDPVDGRALWTYLRHLAAQNAPEYWWAKINPVPVELAFRTDAVFVPEGSSVFADVVLSDIQLEAVAVNFVTNDDSAVYGEDYLVRLDGVEQPMGTVIISAGETVASLEIVAIADEMQEMATEAAAIELIPQSKGLLGSQTLLEIRIGDSDERPVVQFEEPAARISESGGESYDLVVSMGSSLGRSFAVSIDYAVSGGSATIGEDFIIEVDGVVDMDGSGTLNFDPDDPVDPEDPFDVSRVLTVTALDDALFERAETLVIELSNPVNALAPLDAGRWLAGITILDNDLAARPSVSFVDDSGSTAEAPAAGGAAVVALSHATGAPVEVDYLFEAATASSQDFTPAAGTSGTLVFEPGETMKQLAFAVTDDGIVEGPEYFRVALTQWRFASPGSTLLHTHSIEDNDGTGIYLSLDSAFPQQVSESVGTLVLTYHVSSTAHSGFTVSVSGTGTAQGNLVDYNLEGDSFFVEPGAASGSIALQIVDDDTAEQNENINLVLTPGEEEVTWLPRTPPLDSLLILDDDQQRQVQFALSAQAVAEGDGLAEVIIQLSEPTGAPVTVDVAAIEGQAQAGEDYRFPENTITIPPGDTEYRFQMELVDDAVYEFDEVLALRLSNPSSNAFLGGRQILVLTIADDDPLPEPLVNFAQAASEVEETNEDFTIQIPLILAQPVNVQVSASVALRGGEALRNEDFVTELGPVIFAPGETEAVMSLTILGDLQAEGDEDVVLRITDLTNGVRGPVSEHVLTILDDEGAPAVRFAAAGSPAAESIGTALVPIVLPAPAREDVTVAYSVAAGTADESDFTAATGSIQFSAGETLAFAPVEILDDAQLEANKTIMLSLDAATGLPLGFPREHVLTIQDDDTEPSVFIGAPGGGAILNVSESAGEISVFIGLSRPALTTSSVRYSISGTATPGEDFNLPLSVVAFAPGETFSIVTVEIIDDFLVEGPESLAIILEQPNNLVLDSASTITYTILDDDGTGVSCPLPCATPCEGTALESLLEANVRFALLDLAPDPDLADLDQTGLGDAAHAALLDVILADPTLPNHCCVAEAWMNNLAHANSIIDAIFPELVGVERDALQGLLAGVFTTRLVTGSLIVGEGSSAIELDVADYDTSAWPYLAAEGDADLDGVCNAGEYSATLTNPPDIDGFLFAALNAAIADDGGGCMPCLGEGGACAENGIHSADTLPPGAPDRVISLSELLRAIQFFNSASFGCEAGTEDGYQPGDPDQNCCPHDSDYNGAGPDWRIDLSELLRLIQLFNTGGYNWCPDSSPATEDGFCPGLG